MKRESTATSRHASSVRLFLSVSIFTGFPDGHVFLLYSARGSSDFGLLCLAKE